MKINLSVILFEIDLFGKYENWIDIFSISTDNWQASLFYVQFREGKINNIDILFTRDLIRKIGDIISK